MVKAKWPDIVPFTFDYNWRFQVLRVWEGVTWADFVKQDRGLRARGAREIDINGRTENLPSQSFGHSSAVQSRWSGKCWQ
jgi:hypothetical protein